MEEKEKKEKAEKRKKNELKEHYINQKSKRTEPK